MVHLSGAWNSQCRLEDSVGSMGRWVNIAAMVVIGCNAAL